MDDRRTLPALPGRPARVISAVRGVFGRGAASRGMAGRCSCAAALEEYRRKVFRAPPILLSTPALAFAGLF